MKIVVDDNIPLGHEAFSTIAEVVIMAGRDITKADLMDTDGLAVRSLTKVNADLLDGTPVRMVATATIGTDHLDMAYMDAQGIKHSSAPGCNADSVSDYITATLLLIAQKEGLTLEGKTIGVVGCGNVGSRVVKRAQALGMIVRQNDPPLQRKTGDPRYLPLNDLLDSDFITIHTPLTRNGQDATYHLFDAKAIGQMRESAYLINSSRGSVVDNKSLKAALTEGHIKGAALDVWEGEPIVAPDLVSDVLMASPHIAGHSFDGKVNGTIQIYRQFCEWIGTEPTFDASPLLPAPDVPTLALDAKGKTDEDVLREAVFAIYPITEDDVRMRKSVEAPEDDARGKAFDSLRKNYPRRREFQHTLVTLTGGSEQLAEKLRGLTFNVVAN